MAILSSADLKAIVHEAFNNLSLDPASNVQDADTFDEFGIDSLGMSQIVLFMEEKTQHEIDEKTLEKMAASHCVGDVTRLLCESYAAAKS